MQAGRTPQIFISYRRTDSEYIVGRMYDRLVAEFGDANIFKDVESIPPGKDFREVLGAAVNACDVMLLVIGPDWLDAKSDDGRRRLDLPNDYVRYEIETALARTDVLIIPILVKGATPPDADRLPPSIQKIAFFNAVPVRRDPDFNRDIRFLIKYLRDDPAAEGYLHRNIEISQGLDTTALKPGAATPVETAPHPATPAPATPKATTTTPEDVRANRQLLGGLGVLGLLIVAAVAVALLSGVLGGDSADENGSGQSDSQSDAQSDGQSDGQSADATGLRTPTPTPTPVSAGGFVVAADVLGFNVSATLPDGWQGIGANGELYIASNVALLNEIISPDFLDDTASLSYLTELRAETSGTAMIVGLQDGQYDPVTGLRLTGVELVDTLSAALVMTYGIVPGTFVVDTAAYTGGRLVLDMDNYLRVFDFYDLWEPYLSVVVLADDLQALNDGTAAAGILESITVTNN